MQSFFPVAVLSFSALLWGVTWWPLKYFHQQGLDGPPLILASYGLVAVALLPWLWRARRHRRYLAIIFALGGWANLAFATSMIYGEVVRAMMLFYLAPVWGVLGGRLFLGESIDRRRWFGVALAVSGAALVLGGWRLLQAPPSPVDLLALSAGLAFALNNVTCRAAAETPVGGKTAATFLGAGVMSAAVLAYQGQGMPTADAATWGWVAVFGLGWLLLASLTSMWAVSRLEAGRASIIMVLELLAAVVSAVLIGGEMLSPVELTGGALVFLAALLEARRAGEVREPAPQPVIL